MAVIKLSDVPTEGDHLYDDVLGCSWSLGLDTRCCRYRMVQTFVMNNARLLAYAKYPHDLFSSGTGIFRKAVTATSLVRLDNENRMNFKASDVAPYKDMISHPSIQL
eukprot:TRINITY_DN96834_c0_g1_i1.p1 TRINITY_DN96834_c0_g1~~TRINITY_DN96834_c0_g1_i1.p1  ORF type:complete len:107 (+),score=8.35 TRINITY_DN96834_c0_g1_i1:245-565(+)